MSFARLSHERFLPNLQAVSTTHSKSTGGLTKNAMASNANVTHAKNLENLRIAINIVNELGNSYRPANPLIGLESLRDFGDRFANLLTGVAQAVPDEQTAVGLQISEFASVTTRVRRITKAARSLPVSKEFLANLRSTLRRLTGGIILGGPESPPSANGDTGTASTEPTPATIPRSYGKRSYSAVLETLELLEEQLRNNPAYRPFEPEYQVDGIAGWIDGLQALHAEALRTKAATLAARNARDAHAYNDEDGIHVRARMLKAYCETVLDRKDSRLRTLRRLRFRKLG